MRKGPRSWLGWLGLWLCLLGLPLGAAPLDVAQTVLDISPTRRLEASGALQVCTSLPEATLPQVLAGHCTPDDHPPTLTSRGFDARVFWLRLTLHNPHAEPQEQVLTVGHARMQQVSLFELDAAQGFEQQDSGTSTPLVDKPLPLAVPSFLLTFGPGEVKPLWLRVRSATAVDFRTEVMPLWLGHFHTQQMLLLEAIPLGCLLLCMVYSLGSFFMLRDRSLLYFSLFIGSMVTVELSRSGLLQLFLWPVEQPFTPSLFALSSATSVVFGALFFQAFLTPQPQNRFWLRGLWSMVALFLIAVAWSLLRDYRSGAEWFSRVFTVVLGFIFGLTISVWRAGSRPARILLLSFAAVMLAQAMRLSTVFQWQDFSRLEDVALPWSLTLSSVIILFSLNRHAKETQVRLLKTQLESAARLQFLSQMSHELRSPLTTMLGHLRLMARTELPTAVIAGVRSIWQDASQLLAMIDEILTYAQGNAGKLRLQPQPQAWPDLAQRLQQTAQALTQNTSNRLLCELHGPEDAVLMLDEQRLQQILRNLLGNAARYTRDGDITLRCELQPAGNASAPAWQLQCEVRDTGPGIPAHDQERIFKPFERGDDARLSDHKGIGMGLAVARQLVQAMGGKLLLVSEVGHGSSFSFTLVCDAAQADDLETHEWDRVLAPTRRAQAVQDAAASPFAERRLIRRPPPAQLLALQALIGNGQISDALDCVRALAQQQAEFQPFSTAVSQALLQLDFEALHALCEAQRRSTDMTPEASP